MSEETKVKRGYRKVKAIVEDTVKGANGITIDDVVTKTGISKWYCQQKLNGLVEKNLIKLEDGKYFVV